MRRASDEAGFTVVEMVVACALGLVVLSALVGLVQAAQRSATRTAQRTDAQQRGRLAMEQLVQGLRSQVCLQSSQSSAPSTIVAGDGASVTFFAGVATPDAATSGLPKAFAPQRRTYTFSPASGTITQTGHSGTYDSTTGLWVFTTPLKSRTILEAAAAPGGTVFRYYAYLADGRLDPQPLATPLQPDDLPRVAQVRISFTARPTGGKADSQVETSFDDTVTLRLLFPAPKTALQNRTAACVI